MNIGFFLHFPFRQKAARSFGSPNPSILKAAILFFLLDCLLSVPLFTAWTSTQDEHMRVLYGDRPNECSVIQPAGGPCGVNICHVPSFRGCKHFLMHLFPVFAQCYCITCPRNQGPKVPPVAVSLSPHRRADCCYTLPTNSFILFYTSFSLEA